MKNAREQLKREYQKITLAMKKGFLLKLFYLTLLIGAIILTIYNPLITLNLLAMWLIVHRLMVSVEHLSRGVKMIRTPFVLLSMLAAAVVVNFFLPITLILPVASAAMIVARYLAKLVTYIDKRWLHPSIEPQVNLTNDKYKCQPEHYPLFSVIKEKKPNKCLQGGSFLYGTYCGGLRRFFNSILHDMHDHKFEAVILVDRRLLYQYNADGQYSYRQEYHKIDLFDFNDGSYKSIKPDTVTDEIGQLSYKRMLIIYYDNFFYNNHLIDPYKIFDAEAHAEHERFIRQSWHAREISATETKAGTFDISSRSPWHSTLFFKGRTLQEALIEPVSTLRQGHALVA